ncbi:MAG: uroporphyrinogen-III synthase [Parasphingorhabdus sp.]
MSLPLLILRPIEGAQSTAAKAQACDLNPIVDPLFEIKPLPWTAPPADQYDAIMFTSANAVKMADTKLQDYAHLPALVVGATTEREAEMAGFKVIQTGKSGVQSLVDMLPIKGFERILRLSGSEYTAVQSDRTMDHIAVYESVCIGLGERARLSLASGVVILIHSLRAAQSLVGEMEKWDIPRARNHIIAISPNVADATGKAWKSIDVAKQPTDEALLTQAARLCSA